MMMMMMMMMMTMMMTMMMMTQLQESQGVGLLTIDYSPALDQSSSSSSSYLAVLPALHNLLQSSKPDPFHDDLTVYNESVEWKFLLGVVLKVEWVLAQGSAVS